MTDVLVFVSVVVPYATPAAAASRPNAISTRRTPRCLNPLMKDLPLSMSVRADSHAATRLTCEKRAVYPLSPPKVQGVEAHMDYANCRLSQRSMRGAVVADGA